MNADARHSGLRTKRCLPTKPHWKPAHHDLPISPIPATFRPLRAKASPNHVQTIVAAPNSANSRFFTDCYPMSAVFASKLTPIAQALDTISALPLNQANNN